jgi:tetratricopeptide (TPR) repeat protein
MAPGGADALASRGETMTTTRLLILILVAIVVLTFTSIAHAGEPSATETPTASQSVAIVFSRSLDGTSCGNAFFVGDGSLLVTARNVVFPRKSSGFHQGDAFVTVLSAHLGQAAEAQVVAQDRELDVLLLRVPWRGHPALQIAQEAELVAAEKLELLAFTNEQAAVVAGRPALLVAPPQVQRAMLDINAVMVRRNATRTIATVAAPPGPGWAGAPMLLPGGDAVAGCYMRTQADGSAGAGVSCGVIRRLIESANASPSANQTSERVEQPSDAGEATLAYLRGISASAARESDVALKHFERFLKLRPTSAIGYREVAGQLRALDRMEGAQLHYAKALEIEPGLISARVLYGQLLHERIMPRAAEEHLRYAWQHGGDGGTAAVLPLCNLLREQGRDKECLPLLDDATRRRPNDAHLWNYLGHSKRALDDPAGAAAAFARAADLTPADPTSRLHAAQQFDAAGQRPRAEEQYQALVAQHPDAATAHFHFARFLARDSSRRDEALARAQQALNLPDDPGAPPRSAIQSLISAIRGGRTSAGNELRL